MDAINAAQSLWIKSLPIPRIAEREARRTRRLLVLDIHQCRAVNVYPDIMQPRLRQGSDLPLSGT